MNLWVDLNQRDEVLAIFEKQGYLCDVEFEYRRKSGETGIAIVSIEKIDLGELGQQTCVIISTQDISERKQAEETLEQSEKYLRSLIENAMDIITILNDDGTIRFETPSLEWALGYKPEELIGRNAFDLVHPDDYRG